MEFIVESILKNKIRDELSSLILRAIPNELTQVGEASTNNVSVIVRFVIKRKNSHLLHLVYSD